MLINSQTNSYIEKYFTINERKMNKMKKIREFVNKP